MRSSQLLRDFTAFVETCAIWHGRPLRIEEAISSNTTNFDRHFTTSSRLTFILTHSYCRFSGGRLTLAGAAHHYEIGADQLVALTWHGPDQVELLEQYGPAVFRRSFVQLA